MNKASDPQGSLPISDPGAVAPTSPGDEQIITLRVSLSGSEGLELPPWFPGDLVFTGQAARGILVMAVGFHPRFLRYEPNWKGKPVFRDEDSE